MSRLESILKSVESILNILQNHPILTGIVYLVLFFTGIIIAYLFTKLILNYKREQKIDKLMERNISVLTSVSNFLMILERRIK